jgi:hypothetical protein
MHGQNDGGGWSQADLRRPQYMNDQHGRRWFADIEKRSGYPTGVIRPRFDAPWYPDQSALKIDPDTPNDIRIDYDALLAERLEGHREYHARAVEESASRRWTVPDEGETYSKELQLIVGKPPQPLEPIVAAMQLNSWILGFSKIADKRLTKFIVTQEGLRQQLFAKLPDLRDESRDDADDVLDELTRPAGTLDEETLDFLEDEHNPEPSPKRRKAKAA